MNAEELVELFASEMNKLSEPERNKLLQAMNTLMKGENKTNTKSKLHPLSGRHLPMGGRKQKTRKVYSKNYKRTKTIKRATRK